MFESGGGGVKYTDLNTDYWTKHFAGLGRILPEAVVEICYGRLSPLSNRAGILKINSLMECVA